MRFRKNEKSGLAKAMRAKRQRGRGRSLRLEALESRHVMAVTLGSIFDIQVPDAHSVLVPLTGDDDDAGPIAYEFSSSDPSLTLALVSNSSRSLRLNVSGTDGDGGGFAGTLTIKLFEDLAPATTAKIIDLVEEGFYNNLEFHRIIDGFMAQGGANSSVTVPNIDDEFNSSLTFLSRGLFAMANAGDDTGNSQFFITAVTDAGSTSPDPQATMPSHLTFRHTIFGQLVDGFETFRKIMTTDVVSNNGNPPETSVPVNDITITSATIVTDTQNAVLRVTAPAGFAGDDAVITVTAKNGANQTAVRTFNVDGVEDTLAEPPFLSAPVANQTTTKGTAMTFTLPTAVDINGSSVFFKVGDGTTFGTNANVTIAVNQTTRVVTLTPAANFTGTISLKAGVRSINATDVLASYDTETFTLTVTDNGTGNGPATPTGLAVAASSNTGPFDGNGFVSTGTPTLTVTAATGSTVKFLMGTTEIATGTETAAGSGIFTAVIPAGKLAVGPNAITATAANTGGTSAASTALSVIFAPNYATGVYVVPGAAGVTQSLTAQWLVRNAGFSNEIGYFVADAASGAVGSVAPGSAGYAQAALSSTTRKVIFTKGETAGATEAISEAGGKFLVFYMVQNNTTSNFLAKNADNSPDGNNRSNAPVAFFSVTAANPDGKKHAQVIADQTTGRVQYNWEDLLGLGDSDFNDVAMRVSLAAESTLPQASVRAPGTGASETTTVNGTLAPGSQSTLGDIGVFFVDGPNGNIGSLTPGSSGYAAAALASANSRVLFTSGRAAGAAGSVTVPAGKYLGFYALSTGTTVNFLTANPTNSSTGSAVAMFSFDAANPSGINHFRWHSGEQQSTSPDATRLYVMDEVFGNTDDFNELAVDISFAT